MAHPSPTASYYGWRIAWALAITQTVGFGVLYYTFGVFVGPMEAELGWSRTETSAAFSLALLVSGLAAIPVGRWFDRHGARALMTAGSIWGALLVWGWAQVQSLTAFYLLWAGLGLAMAMVLYEVAFAVLAVWFRRYRPRAMLVVTLTAGLASTIFVPLSTWLVQLAGWRGALEILALILAVSTIPLHALVLRRRPEDIGQVPDGEESAIPFRNPAQEPSTRAKEALRQPTFWWLSLGFALSRATSIALTAHLVPLLTEKGYSPALVALAAGGVGVVQLAGRILYTPLSERVSLFHLSGAFLGGYALGLLSLLFLPPGLGLGAFVLFFGLANGSISLAKPALLAEIYGAKHYGTINGSMTSIVAVAQTIAPFATGALHGLSGNYNPALWLLAALATISALAIWQARPSAALAEP
ncbi:MAG: MFS transporter [Meiothermus sp.]|uniref:MFS transporter n=1 Tax=Meiothermus sp. TaxID=1955249 RepID=UPI0025DF7AA2|nr:MFS transporter [Meiothermus sp.]MCS7067272.1 MFS transporter [Meiothermus sp.]MDW8425560.1 MFS transporter [Meiothermus sp.]